MQNKELALGAKENNAAKAKLTIQRILVYS